MEHTLRNGTKIRGLRRVSVPFTKDGVRFDFQANVERTGSHVRVWAEYASYDEDRAYSLNDYTVSFYLDAPKAELHKIWNESYNS
jgi:hypothetical protein